MIGDPEKLAVDTTRVETRYKTPTDTYRESIFLENYQCLFTRFANDSFPESSFSVVILEEIKEGLLSAVKEGTGPGREGGSVTFQGAVGKTPPNAHTFHFDPRPQV